MPPKITFTKEDVITASFKIAQKKGLKNLTARRIAKRLKSSTAPVYSNFSSMKELKREVMKKAQLLLLEYSTRSYTERVFLNMGIGYALFARDQSQLFRALFLEKGYYKDIVDEYVKSLKKEILNDLRFTELLSSERDALLTNMWIFTHGLAALISEGIIEESSETYIKNILVEVGGAVIRRAVEESKNK